MPQDSEDLSPEARLRAASVAYAQAIAEFREQPRWQDRLCEMLRDARRFPTALNVLAHFPWYAERSMLPALVRVLALGRVVDHLKADLVLRAFDHCAIREQLTDITVSLLPDLTGEMEGRLDWLADLIVEVDCPEAMERLLALAAEHSDQDVREWGAGLGAELGQRPEMWGRRVPAAASRRK